MNDDKERAVAELGRRFREWCEGDQGLFAVLGAVERKYLEEIAGSTSEEGPLREALYHRIQALRDVSAAMRNAITAGKSAEAVIEALTRRNERARKAKTPAKA